MAKKNKKQAVARKKDAEFSASYELTSLMSEEAVSLLTPNGASNPVYIAATVGIVVLLAYIFFSGDAVNSAVCVAGAAVCIALIIVAARWRDAQVRRLQRNGLDAARLPEDLRRFTVDVWRDRVEVTEPSGEMQVFPVADIRRVVASDRMIVLVMAEGRMVLIPRKALSLQRFTQCLDLLKSVGPKKGLAGAKKKEA